MIRRSVRAAALAGMLSTLVAPLYAAPPVHADIFDDVIDQLFAPFTAASTAFDPHPAANTDFDAGVDQYFYTPVHAGIEEWIGSGLGRRVDDVVNAVLGSYAIGNGAAGTAEHHDGFAGGWLLGDGGSGWDSTAAGVAGGTGGAAGLFGDGGSGGDGGAGAAGGDGGAGGSWMGTGGNGGDGGDGAGLFGLPALGGAGGVAGHYGAHGAVGQFGILAGGPPPVGPAAIQVVDGRLTNTDGQVVTPHGVNVVNKEAPYEPAAVGFNDADAARLAASGVNTVRLGVLWSGVEPQPGVYNNAYLASIAETVQSLANYGITSLLDMHQDLYSDAINGAGDGAPAWAVQTGGLPAPDAGFPYTYAVSPAENHAWDAFWSNSPGPNGVGLQNSYTQMWQYVANYFNGKPGVAGYELMNEPWAGSAWLPTAAGGSQFDAQTLTPFYNQVDSGIRSVDASTPVFFEPNTLFGNLPVNTHLDTVNDPNSVFAFHNYCPSASVFGSGLLCGAYDDLIMSWAKDYSSAHGIPAVMTEFGNTGDTGVLASAIAAAAKQGFGWLFWEYDPQVVGHLGQPAATADVDDAVLNALATPYPQLVSGTPGASSFNAGTWAFSYTTGGFPAGSQTVISVPASLYPAGYQVSVSGGHIASAAGDAQLVITSDAGARTITVTVRP